MNSSQPKTQRIFRPAEFLFLRFLSALLIVSIALPPSSAYALRPVATAQSGAEETLSQSLKPSAGAEEGQRQLLLKWEFPGAKYRSDPAFDMRGKFTGPFQEELRVRLKDELTLEAYRRVEGGRLLSLKEAIYNLILHGGGGTVEVYRFQESDRKHSSLLIQLIDHGPGITDPNILLEQSVQAHDDVEKYDPQGDYSHSGMGFVHIFAGPDRFWIDSNGWHWERIARDRLIQTGQSSVTEGTVMSLLYDWREKSLYRGDEPTPNPWKSSFEISADTNSTSKIVLPQAPDSAGAEEQKELSSAEKRWAKVGFGLLGALVISVATMGGAGFGLKIDQNRVSSPAALSKGYTKVPNQDLSEDIPALLVKTQLRVRAEDEGKVRGWRVTTKDESGGQALPVPKGSYRFNIEIPAGQTNATVRIQLLLPDGAVPHAHAYDGIRLFQRRPSPDVKWDIVAVNKSNPTRIPIPERNLQLAEMLPEPIYFYLTDNPEWQHMGNFELELTVDRTLSKSPLSSASSTEIIIESAEVVRTLQYQKIQAAERYFQILFSLLGFTVSAGTVYWFARSLRDKNSQAGAEERQELSPTQKRWAKVGFGLLGAMAISVGTMGGWPIGLNVARTWEQSPAALSKKNYSGIPPYLFELAEDIQSPLVETHIRAPSDDGNVPGLGQLKIKKIKKYNTAGEILNNSYLLDIEIPAGQANATVRIQLVSPNGVAPNAHIYDGIRILQERLSRGVQWNIVAVDKNNKTRIPISEESLYMAKMIPDAGYFYSADHPEWENMGNFELELTVGRLPSGGDLSKASFRAIIIESVEVVRTLQYQKAQNAQMAFQILFSLLGFSAVAAPTWWLYRSLREKNPEAGQEERVVSNVPFPAGLEPGAKDAIHAGILELNRSVQGNLTLVNTVANFRAQGTAFARTLSTEETDLLKAITHTTDANQPRPPTDVDALLVYVENASVKAGAEEAWIAPIREALVNAFPVANDKITFEDILAFRWAQTPKDIRPRLRIYAEILNSPLSPELEQQAVDQINLWREPARQNPDNLRSAVVNLGLSTTNDQFLGRLIEVETAAREYLATLPPHHSARQFLEKMIEPKLTDDQRGILLKAAEMIAKAFGGTLSDDEKKTWARELAYQKTRELSLRVLAEEMIPLAPISPTPSAFFQVITRLALQSLGRHRGVAIGTDTIAISVSYAAGSRSSLSATAAHEYTHLALDRMEKGYWGDKKGDSLWEKGTPSNGPGQNYADWITVPAQIIVGMKEAADSAEPISWITMARYGPLVTQWVYEKGRSFAGRPSNEWVSELKKLEELFPPDVIRYAQGYFIAGIASELGRMAAERSPGTDRWEQSLYFLNLFARYPLQDRQRRFGWAYRLVGVKPSPEAIILRGLDKAASAFRQENGLVVQFAGAEERETEYVPTTSEPFVLSRGQRITLWFASATLGFVLVGLGTVIGAGVGYHAADAIIRSAEMKAADIALPNDQSYPWMIGGGLIGLVGSIGAIRMETSSGRGKRSAGAEERIVVRLNDQQQAVLMKEGLIGRIPGYGKTVALQPPAERLAKVSEVLSGKFSTLETLLVQAYQSKADPIDISAIKQAIIQLNSQSEVSRLSNTMSLSRFRGWVESLNSSYFHQIGTHLLLRQTLEGERIWARYQFGGAQNWERIPYLNGTIYLNQGKVDRELPFQWAGTHPANSAYALMNLDAARLTDQKEKQRYQEGRWSVLEKQLLIDQIYKATDESQRQLGMERSAFLEETRHAQDAVWASFYHGVDGRRVNHGNLLVAEALVRPDSFTDKKVWLRAKEKYQTDRNLDFFSDTADAINELAGSMGSLRQQMKELILAGKDQQAFLIFALDFVDQMRTANQGHPNFADRSVAYIYQEAVSSFVGVQNPTEILPYFMRQPSPGQAAFDWVDQFYRQNTWTDEERIALLEGKTVAEVLASSAGAEENPDPFRMTLPQMVGTHPFPIRVFSAANREEVYIPDATGRTNKPQMTLLGETLKQSAGNQIARYLEQDLVYYLTTLSPERIADLAAPSDREILTRLKRLIDEAGVTSPNMTTEAAINHLIGPLGSDGTPSYGNLINYTNRILLNEGNPRERPRLLPIKDPEEIVSLDLWSVKEGDITTVLQAEVRLRSGVTVRMVVNVAKDRALAADLLRKDFHAITEDYAKDPRFIMQPFALGTGTATSWNGKADVLVFVGEWLDDFHELHLYPEDNGRFAVWTDQRAERHTVLSEQESSQIGQAIDEILSIYDRENTPWINPRDMVNGGDFVAHQETDGSWQVMMIWHRTNIPSAGAEEQPELKPDLPESNADTVLLVQKLVNEFLVPAIDGEVIRIEEAKALIRNILETGKFSSAGKRALRELIDADGQLYDLTLGTIKFLNAHVFLSNGIVFGFLRREKLRPIPVIGYELYRFPGNDTPFMVGFTQVDWKVLGEKSMATADPVMALAIIQAGLPLSTLKLMRLEELSHLEDAERFGVERSKTVEKLIRRIKFREKATLPEFIKVISKGDTGLSWQIVTEARAALRELQEGVLTLDNSDFGDLLAVRKEGFDEIYRKLLSDSENREGLRILQEELGFDEHEFSTIWVAARLRALDPSISRRDADRIKELASEIWSQEFNSKQDPIGLQARRVYPKTQREIEAQLTRLSSAGQEELQTRQAMTVLDEAAPQGAGVLVIEAGAFTNRGGLEEFVARAGQALNKRFILFGSESAAVKELALRNGITVVDSNDPVDLAFRLAGMEERANRIGYLGDPENANLLSRILPSSMTVTALNPKAALRDILLFLGYPSAVLDGINAVGLEEQLAASTAA